MKGSVLDRAQALMVWIVEDMSVASDEEGERYYLFLTQQAAREYRQHLDSQALNTRMRKARLTFESQ